MSQGLPSWWLALVEQGRLGLAHGSGPFWSERFLCGQPIFSAVELPFASPSAGLLLAWGPMAWLFFNAIVLSAGLALWLRSQGEVRGWDRRQTGLLAGLTVAAGLLHPEASVLLGCWAWLPWTLLLAGRAPALAAAPFGALLLSGGSPVTMVMGVLGSGLGTGWNRRWRRAWGVAALLAAPAWLELLRLAPGTQRVTQGNWPLGPLGSPLLVFQGGLVLLAALLAGGSWLGRRSHWALGLAAVGLVVAPLALAPTGGTDKPEDPAYLRLWTRRQAPLDGMPRQLPVLLAQRWTGALGGPAPADARRRWRDMTMMGLRDPDALCLSAVGWADGTPGQRWFKPVQAAWVESAEGPLIPPRAGTNLFDRPLRLLDREPPSGQQGALWHLVDAQNPAPGDWEMDLGGEAHGWAFLSESADAGWRVDVDGKARQTAVADGDLLAAPLQPGDRRVHWKYRPATGLWGAWLAVLGLLGWAAMVAADRSSKRLTGAA